MAKRSKGGRQSNISLAGSAGAVDTGPSSAGASSEDSTPVAPATRELPVAAPDAQAYDSVSLDAEDVEEEDAGATREAVAIPAPHPLRPDARPIDTVILPAPPEQALDVGAQQPAAPPTGDIPSQDTPAPRQRFNTLAGAFSRPRPDTPPFEFEAANDLAQEDELSGIVDEVDPEVEWSVADQPTVQLSQEDLRQLRPSFLDTGEQESWPPRPNTPPPALTAPHPPAPPNPPMRPVGPSGQFDWRSSLPPRPQPPFPLNDLNSPLAQGDRLMAPDGRAAQAPTSGEPAPDFRMERLQELRRHRDAHEHGDPATDDVTPVADAVRQWWKDLRPGVGGALKFQREARESGSHPLPAYTPTVTSRLGDAFGRLAASARGMTERAQQAAGPTFKAIHASVEQAAQGLIQVFEGNAAQQQAPLLGPGRVAIFFRKGVSVGQAQRLLAASSARPMRLIPRKHGILAQVMPGLEADIGERLRRHPYVDDVVYMEYNERGGPRDKAR